MTSCSLSTIENNNNSIKHDSQPNTNIIVEVDNNIDDISSNDPIELMEQFENNNLTTNSHNDNPFEHLILTTIKSKIFHIKIVLRIKF